MTAVTILVTHLLGVGHLARAAAIGRALAQDGFDVTLISGGMPAGIDAGGARFVQLPPRRIVGTDFRNVLNAEAQQPSAAEEDGRRRALRQAIIDAAPEVFVVELYPFGRRAMRGEFDAALATAAGLRPRPAILCSIRDILAPPRPAGKARQTEDVLGRCFEAVLVHADRALVPLDLSWPVGPDLERRLEYTGYVDESTAESLPRGRRARRVIVSGGGSAAGLPLFSAAIGARDLLDPSIGLHLLVGQGVPEAEFSRLSKEMRPGLTVERARRDFRALLASSDLSVSRAGYNTVLDIAATGVRAILVPFEDGGETEQRLRAERLAETGFATHLPPARLSPQTLADAVETAIAAPPPAAPSFDRAGASRTVAAVRRWAERTRARDRAERRIDDALAAAGRRGMTVDLWWRDDDVTAPSAALDRLLRIAQEHRIAVALAAIPRLVEDSLVQVVDSCGLVDVLVHGIRHANHAPPGARKQELSPHLSIAEAGAGLRDGLARLKAMFGERCLPVLVPPWNRMDRALVPHLAALGFRSLSTFGGPARSEAGLEVVDTHIDPIDWRGGGGCRPTHELMEALAAAIEARVGAFGGAGMAPHASPRGEAVTPGPAGATGGVKPRRDDVEHGRQSRSVEVPPHQSPSGRQPPLAGRHGGAGSADTSENGGVARLGGDSAHPGPIGLLTHHLRHDVWTWGFLEDLLPALKKRPEIRLLPARAVFARTDR